MNRTALIALCLTAAFFVSCAQTQESNVVMRWDESQSSIIDAIALDDGMILLRRTAARTALEILALDGNVRERVFLDRPVVRIMRHDGDVYFIDEAQPLQRRIMRWNPPAPPVEIAKSANWTDLAFSSTGKIYGFESIYSTRDVAPSAVQIHDLTENRIVLEDMNSYQYPMTARSMPLLSPIDRRLRHMVGREYADIGMLNRADFPPVVSHDGRSMAWFGPHEKGTALYVLDEAGSPSVFLAPLTERPIAWAGDDLLIPFQDSLNQRWVLKRFALSNSDTTAAISIPIPDNVDPTAIVSSRSGSVIGLPTSEGSIIIRLSDKFIQDLPGVPLSQWHFSPNGKRLYLLDQKKLETMEF